MIADTIQAATDSYESRYGHPIISREIIRKCAFWVRSEYFRMRILQHLPHHEGGTILDVGCGEGLKTLSLGLKYAISRIIGVDTNKHALGLACERLPYADLHHGSIDDLPVNDASVDVATLFQILHHFSQEDIAEIVLPELSRVLSASGQVAVLDTYTREGGSLRYDFMKYLYGKIAGSEYQGHAPVGIQALFENHGFVLAKRVRFLQRVGKILGYEPSTLMVFQRP